MSTPSYVQKKQKRNAESAMGAPQHAGLGADVMSLQRTAGNSLVNNLVSLLGTGDPLPKEVRGELEHRFGEDFSKVRLHTDARAAETADKLIARAYTFGNNIVFNQGRFTPGTREGEWLLAHELAHVIQQQRGGIAPSFDPGAFHEKAADVAADVLVAGHARVKVGGATAVGIARAPLDNDSTELVKRLAALEQTVNKSSIPKVEKIETIEKINTIRNLGTTDKKTALQAVKGLEERLEVRLEKRSYASGPPYVEVPLPPPRKVNEQGAPSPGMEIRAGNLDKASEGEFGGRAAAGKAGIKDSAGKKDALLGGDTPKKWVPPQSFKGDFGQGIDDRGYRGSNTIVLEYKYGSSRLGGTGGLDVLKNKTVQMSNKWIGIKIAELQSEGATKDARELLEASQKGNLQGAVYWTRKVKGKEVTSRRDGEYLRRHLRKEKISDAGLITYAPGKVYKAYENHLKFIENKKGLTLPPLMLPKSMSKPKMQPKKDGKSMSRSPPISAKALPKPASPVSKSLARTKAIPLSPTPKIPGPPIELAVAPPSTAGTIPGPPTEPGGIVIGPAVKVPVESAPPAVKKVAAPKKEGAGSQTETLAEKESIKQKPEQKKLAPKAKQLTAPKNEVASSQTEKPAEEKAVKQKPAAKKAAATKTAKKAVAKKAAPKQKGAGSQTRKPAEKKPVKQKSAAKPKAPTPKAKELAAPKQKGAGPQTRKSAEKKPVKQKPAAKNPAAKKTAPKQQVLAPRVDIPAVPKQQTPTPQAEEPTAPKQQAPKSGSAAVTHGLNKADTALSAVLDYQRRHKEFLDQGFSEAEATAFASMRAGGTLVVNLKGGPVAAAVNAVNTFENAKNSGQGNVEALGTTIGTVGGGLIANNVAPTGPVGAAVQLLNTATKVFGAPQEVQDTTSIAAELVPSSVVTSAASVVARTGANLVTGDTSALARQADQMSQGQMGTWVQGWSQISGIMADIASGDSAQKALETAAKAGKGSVADRIGSGLADVMYDLSQNEDAKSGKYGPQVQQLAQTLDVLGRISAGADVGDAVGKVYKKDIAQAKQLWRSLVGD